MEFFSPVLCTVFFASNGLLSYITIVETMDSGERGLNPVGMTIINPQIEYCWFRGRCLTHSQTTNFGLSKLKELAYDNFQIL